MLSILIVLSRTIVNASFPCLAPIKNCSLNPVRFEGELKTFAYIYIYMLYINVCVRVMLYLLSSKIFV